MNIFQENDLPELNNRIDPIALLTKIGYEKSSPRKSGGEIRDYCPIHKGDKKRSLAISERDHIYHCHSCNERGDLIDLYCKAMNRDIPDAKRELSDYFNVIISKMKMEEDKKYTAENVQKSWESAKKDGNDTYFKKKGLTPPTIARFGKNPSGYPATLIPLQNIEGDLCGLLSLNENAKFNYKKSTLDASFALLGEIPKKGEVFIGEGIATIQTAWEAFDRKIASIAAGTWSNIPKVVDAVKSKYPDVKPIILIDIDSGGKGEQSAKQVAEKHPEVEYRKPSFETFKDKMKENSKYTDFNDVFSLSDIKEVRLQLEVPYFIKKEGFYDLLGTIIENPDHAIKLQNRKYETFENEHKKLFSAGGFVSGFPSLDEQVHFCKGDFVVVQARSNHGKSSFMLQLARNFAVKEENQQQNPICIFITYESSPLRIEEKLINLIGHENDEGTAIRYFKNNPTGEKYLYCDPKDFRKSLFEFNMTMGKTIHILPRILLEKVPLLVDLYKREHPERTIALFLDYIQIIDTQSKEDGWQLIKYISKTLEKTAIEKEILIFTASQTNEQGDPREGKDIYNSATTYLDLFNHSHISLKEHTAHGKKYKEPLNGRNICSIKISKQKHGSAFEISEGFLFNGFNFKEKDTKSPRNF